MTDSSIYRQQYLSQLNQVQGIKIEALPLYSHIPSGLKLEMPVLFRILVGDHNSQLQRQPLHLCVVLDRSGSMLGRPLENCKLATRKLFDQLRPEDRISLVAYDDIAESIFECRSVKDKNNLFPLINAITDRNCTNIGAALQLATQILNKPTENTYQKVVFLMSDGIANRGITNLDKLGTLMTPWVETDRIRFSAFGLGAEYNEEWMTSIARGGEGSYHFIDEIEEIGGILEKGLSGFTASLGEHATFQVKGQDPHKLVSFQGETTPEVLSSGRIIPTIRSLGMYQFLTTVEVQPLNSGVHPIMNYELNFKPVDGVRHLGHHQGILNLTVSETKSSVSDINQLGSTQLILDKNVEVMAYLILDECATLNLKVEEAMRAKNQAEAVRLKEQVITKYESVLHFDKYGVIGALLLKEKKTLEVLKTESLGDRSMKMQNCSASFGYSQGAARTSAVSKKKAVWETAKVKAIEEECDMGFTLFD